MMERTVKNTVRHVGLVTKNIKLSKRFWINTLNFKIQKHAYEKGKEIDRLLKLKNVEVETYKLKDRNDFVIELLFFRKLPKKINRKAFNTYNYGFTHIAIKTTNINKLYKKLKKIGTKFNSDPILSKDKKVKVLYCETPEGTFLEIVEVLSG
jgi:catechol 2,3-dioxygenase-like lactoylglutathione lyase family enzyme